MQLVIFLIFIVYMIFPNPFNRFFVKILDAWEDEPKRVVKNPHLIARRNIPLQYAYTIDEWYNLRLEFDKIIAEDWELFRNNQISSYEYKEKCKKAVQEIIGMEHWEHFRTLYEWGVRNAAIKIAEEGCAPGVISHMELTNFEVATWYPTDYFTYGGKVRCDWKRCIPRKDYEYEITSSGIDRPQKREQGFLDLYPDGELLEEIGCGTYDDGAWFPIIDKEAKYTNRYYSGNGLGDIKERMRAVDYFISRGFDGQKYADEDRNYGDLTIEEIAKKYQFIIKDPCTGEIEKSANLFIDKRGYKRRRFID